jgi:hypothetical protein
MNTQTLILDSIASRLTAHGLTLVQDKGYANTGTVYTVADTAVEDNDPTPHGNRFHYRFDDSRWEFNRPGEIDPAVCYSEHGGAAPWVYTSPLLAVQQIVRLLAAVTD